MLDTNKVTDLNDVSDSLVPMLREVVLGRMGRSGDEATVAEARRRFEEHYNGTARLPADIRAAVRKTIKCCVKR